MEETWLVATDSLVPHGACSENRRYLGLVGASVLCIGKSPTRQDGCCRDELVWRRTSVAVDQRRIDQFGDGDERICDAHALAKARHASTPEASATLREGSLASKFTSSHLAHRRASCGGRDVITLHRGDLCGREHALLELIIPQAQSE